jgi:superfamily II DNA/RNA helicase
VHRIGRTGRAGASGLTIMMMTGSDERSVAAIERLTKQKFEATTVTPQRRERGRERDEARRPRREARAEAPRAPADDFFSRPYEPGGTGAAPPPPVEPPQPDRPQGRVAALLGGKRK